MRKIVFQHLCKTGGTSIRDLIWAFLPVDRTVDPHHTFSDDTTIEEAMRHLFAHDFIHGHPELLTCVPPGAFKFAFFREPFARLLSHRRQWMSAAMVNIATMQPDSAEATLSLQKLSLRDIMDQLTAYPVTLSSFWNHQSVTLGAWPLVRKFSARRASVDYDYMNLYRHFASARDLLAWQQDNKAAIMKQAMQSLDALDYVGLTETFDLSVCEVFARIGLPEPGKTPVVNAREAFGDEGDEGLRDLAAPALQWDYELYEAAKERHARFRRVARGSPVDYTRRLLEPPAAATFDPQAPPCGHGWHLAHRRDDGRFSRWTRGEGRSHFALGAPAGAYQVSIRLWGAVSEAAILTMQLEIDGIVLESKTGHDAEGWSIAAQFERAMHGAFDLVLVVPGAKGEHGVEVRQISFRSSGPDAAPAGQGCRPAPG